MTLLPPVPVPPVAQALYLPPRPGGNGRLFAMLYTPQTAAPCGAMVYVHPLADEMNKARRMAARQARALAQRGWLVLTPDLSGCGDSAGDFADAQWQHWLLDVVHAAEWLRARHASTLPLWLWGLRLGAVLAAQAAGQPSLACNGLLAWQPSASGKLALQQFLRLVTASRLVAAPGAAAAKTELTPRQQLAQGQTVQVAGYPMSPALAAGIEGAGFALPPGVSRLIWLELSTAADATLSPAANAVLARCRSAGCAVQAEVVPGPPFWQTLEIEDAPQLLARSLNLLEHADQGRWEPAP